MDPIYDVARAVLVAPVRFGMRWTTDGVHRIPPRGPVILASNHISYLDPFVLAWIAQQRNRRVRFLAKAELFTRRGVGSVLRQLGQIPVARATADAAASLAVAASALELGACVAVFPEGTISPDLEPMAGHTGTARLAATAGVPVFPIGLWGSHRILTKGRSPHWQYGVAESVVVGPPLRVVPDASMEHETERIMAAIASAVARAREIYPQAPAAGDDPWWVREPASAHSHRSVEPIAAP